MRKAVGPCSGGANFAKPGFEELSFRSYGNDANLAMNWLRRTVVVVLFGTIVGLGGGLGLMQVQAQQPTQTQEQPGQAAAPPVDQTSTQQQEAQPRTRVDQLMEHLFSLLEQLQSRIEEFKKRQQSKVEEFKKRQQKAIKRYEQTIEQLQKKRAGYEQTIEQLQKKRAGYEQTIEQLQKEAQALRSIVLGRVHTALQQSGFVVGEGTCLRLSEPQLLMEEGSERPRFRLKFEGVQLESRRQAFRSAISSALKPLPALTADLSEMSYVRNCSVSVPDTAFVFQMDQQGTAPVCLPRRDMSQHIQNDPAILDRLPTVNECEELGGHLAQFSQDRGALQQAGLQRLNCAQGQSQIQGPPPFWVAMPEISSLALCFHGGDSRWYVRRYNLFGYAGLWLQREE